MKRALITSACLIVLAWLGLTSSTWAIVVWQSGPRAAPGHVRPAIYCTYFDGVKLFERGFLYAPDDQMGYKRCPMWVPV